MTYRPLYVMIVFVFHAVIQGIYIIMTHLEKSTDIYIIIRSKNYIVYARGEQRKIIIH